MCLGSFILGFVSCAIIVVVVLCIVAAKWKVIG